tara:strand:- start:517 stop:972 length:456 start_codon:yes stop_codon:yes gene_type:complete
MKITRRQLRALIKEEHRRALQEASGKRDQGKCVAAAKQYAKDQLKRELTAEELKGVEESCKEDDVVSWYDDEKEEYAGKKSALKEQDGYYGLTGDITDKQVPMIAFADLQEQVNGLAATLDTLADKMTMIEEALDNAGLLTARHKLQRSVD